MNAPRVSVVIPTFNRSRLVQLAIESVLAQQFRDFEIIVVDDGSTDDTAACLARYGDPVRVVRQDNLGMNPARNAGIALARGEYIALLDSDDLWLPGKLALQVAILDRLPEAGFLFSEFFIMKDGEGTQGERRAHGLQSWYPRPHDWAQVYPRVQRARDLGVDAASDFPVYQGCIYERSLHEPVVLPSTALIRRATLERHSLRLPVSADTHGDWEFFARLSRVSGAAFMDCETTINRSHEDAVRLTRVDPLLRLARRVSMIDRVWRADPEFAAAHAADLDARQRALLCRLARMHLVAGQAADSRIVLKRAAALRGGFHGATEWTTYCLAHLPGGGQTLRALSRLLQGA